jgi:hypothetical protein
MRTLVLGGVLAGALVFPTPASAGCWATVGLAPPPVGTAAGDVWAAKITVLQHGANPLPDAAAATPRLTIVNRATGQRRTFPARATDPSAGTYAARVVFPSGGTWSYQVFDGFTSWNDDPAPCAQTHTFKDVEIGGPGSGGGAGGTPAAPTAATTPAAEFPVWPVAGAFAALVLTAVGVGGYFLRRARSRPAAA